MTVQQSALVTKSNIFSQVHANIYNLINNRSNVPDPNDASGNRKFVYTREPFNLIDKFPLIIIPDVQYKQGQVRIAGTKAIQVNEINLIIIGQDKESDGSGDAIGRETVAAISNNVMQTLNDITNRRTLISYGMSNIKVDSTDFDWGEIDGKPTFKREISISFSGWGTIS